MVLEPLRFGRQFLDGGRFRPVHVEHEGFPGALPAAGVEVHLGEAVDRVDRRRRVGNPGNVVRPAVALLARAVPLNERAQRPRRRIGRMGYRRLQMGDDVADLRIVSAADAIDLFDNAAGDLHEPGVQRIFFIEPLELFCRHTRVQIIGARREDIAAAPGRLGRDRRIERRIEEHRPQPHQHLIDRFARAQRERRAFLGGGVYRRRKLFGRALQDELSRGEIVIGPAVGPEQLRVAFDFGAHRRLARGMADERLHDVAHVEVVDVPLVVEDVAAGDRRLIEVPGQDALLDRQRREPVRVQLHDGGFVDPLHQIRPPRRRGPERTVRRARWLLGIRCGRRARARDRHGCNRHGQQPSAHQLVQLNSTCSRWAGACTFQCRRDSIVDFSASIGPGSPCTR